MDTKTGIDLQPFCDIEPSRFSFETPFTQSGWKYATDGKIMARVPDAGSVDTVRPDGGRLPRCADIMAGYDSVKEWHPIPPPNLSCPACEGRGTKLCDECHGHGEHECKCGHEHDCGNCRDGYVTCKCGVDFGDRQVASWLSEKMRKLPGIEWGVVSDDPTDRIYFRFDQGGSGCVMPLDPRYT